MNDLFMYRLGQKRGGGGGNSGGGEDWIGDGNTHIWISLAEGRTSPMLGVGVNGTVTVDWGDGSEPDTLTGTSISAVVYTPNHEYDKAGDYVITLSGDGEIGIVGDSGYGQLLITKTGIASDSTGNRPYRIAIQRVELANNVKRIGDGAFMYCHALTSVVIPDSVTTISDRTFYDTYALKNVVMPNRLQTIGSDSAFYNCYSLLSLVIPKGLSYLAGQSFSRCYSVTYYDFTQYTKVIELYSSNVFDGMPDDCQIRVPANLVDEWKAATNWSAYGDHIVGV